MYPKMPLFYRALRTLRLIRKSMLRLFGCNITSRTLSEGKLWFKPTAERASCKTNRHFPCHNQKWMLSMHCLSWGPIIRFIKIEVEFPLLKKFNLVLPASEDVMEHALFVR